jgi:enoyl-CoA hydratase/carnithine racemase
MADNFLLYEKDGPIVTLTMNQPAVRNVVTGNSAVDEFLAAFAKIEGDDSVRAVIITGAGTVFSAGGNINEMKRQIGVPAAELRQEYRDGIQRLPRALYNLEVPTIAAVNGPAIGAGCDIACMCDIRIAAETATFAEIFVKLGIVAGDGGAWLLPRIVGASKAAEMSFTGDSISSSEALACGLVSRVVPGAELMAEARALAGRIAANSGPAVRMTKRLMREGVHLSLDSSLEMAAAFQVLAHKTSEHAAAVDAFLDKLARRDTKRKN